MPEPPGASAPRTADAPGRPTLRARAAASLLVVALTLCVGAYVAAVHAHGASFAWRHAMISDLGRAICRDWNGFWVCSPRAAVFNVAVGAAGACILTAAVLSRRRLGRSLMAALACLGVGLVWVAVFPADGPIGVHMVGGVLALPAPSVLLLVHGLDGARRAGARARTARTGHDGRRDEPGAIRAGDGPRVTRVLGTLGAVSSLMSLDHVMPAPAPIARGVAEGISLLALGVALVVVAVDLVWRPVDGPGH